MPDTPLNPEALRAAIEVIADLQYCGSCAGESRCVACTQEATEAVTAYLAVAQPEVTSDEELDKLPDDSIVKDSEDEVYIITPFDEFWRVWGNDKRISSGEIALPARVLYRPEVKP